MRLSHWQLRSGSSRLLVNQIIESMMMKKMYRLNHILFLFLAVLTTSVVSAKKLPNIVVFLVDDMGLMDTSVPFLTDDKSQPKAFPLNSKYLTPSMERLAKQGFRYSRFYANSVCSPTRASLMTGQSSARHRTTQWIRPTSVNGGKYDPEDWNWKGLGKNDVTLPRLLKSAGYHTIHCGKGHFGPFESEGENPKSIGFDVNIAGGSIGRPESYLGKKGYGHLAKKSTWAVPGLESYRGTDTHLSEALTIEINKEIGRAVDAKNPFFAYMSHYAVHSPFDLDERFVDDYKGMGLSGKALAYATLIKGIDHSLGQMMDHLEKLGVAENTLILFLGDNGSDAPLGPIYKHASSAPLRGKKGTHYEGGMRVPFIAAWAKPSADAAIQKAFPIQVGVIQDSSIGTVHDVFPSLLELASVDAPKSHLIDGGSLWRTLAGKPAVNPQKFLMHFPHSHRSSYFTSYQEHHWKLVRHYMRDGKNQLELFNLNDDPYENENLAGENRPMLSRMMSSMKRELLAVNAQFPKPK